ncbi:MAG: hypothetical protein WBX15_09205 [Thermoanaerobaculia bacterium]
MEAWIPIVLFITLFSMISFVVWVGGRTRRERIRSMTELQNRMLDRFATAAEFVDFARTEEGRRFLESATKDRWSPASGILWSVRLGLVGALLGIGFLVLYFVETDFVIPGVLVLAIGLGFLMSAAVSQKLVRKWGLLQDESGT